MSMNSEQEKINSIQDCVHHAILEGIQNIQGLLETTIECEEYKLDSKFPAELALQVVKENILIETLFNTDYCELGFMLIEKMDAQYLIKQLMNHDEAEIELDEFSLSALSEITSLFYQGICLNISNYLGKSIKSERSKIIIIDHKTNGISPYTAKVLSIQFILKFNEKMLPITLFFDFSSFITLFEGQSPKKSKQESKTKISEDIQVKEIRVPKYTSSNENLNSNPSKNLDLIMNVPLNVSIEIGKTKRKIKDIMSFASGYVLELEKQLGAPVDIVVNGQLIARGDVVVIDENFAIRITEIVSTSSLLSNE